MDVLDSMDSKSVGEISYALITIDDFTAYSTVFFLADQSQLYKVTRQFMNRSKRSTGHKLQNICLDGAC